MSKYDDSLITLCNNIIDHGYSTEGSVVRAKWEDGTPAHTKKIFGAVNVYDIGKEMPLCTLRPTAWKTATQELLWIWQKKSNKVSELGNHIWDQWEGEDGTIGKAYGYQLGKKYLFPQGEMDQVDNIIWQLKNTPQSRRMLTNIYNFEDLHEMNLAPCAYSMTFNVTGNKLNAILNQRSQDVLVANAFNVFQYALLLKLLAQVTGYEAGTLIHCIADAHIYDRHIPIVKEMLSRETYPAPKVIINPDIKNFYDFTIDDIQIPNYEANPQIKNIPVAE